jgi:predicted CoA-binding protein
MACTKLEDFDKDNPNYQFLVDGIENGMVKLGADKCMAWVITTAEELKFGSDIKAYLESQGYKVAPVTAGFTHGE